MSGTGVRSLRSIVESVLEPALFDPRRWLTTRITKATVRGGEPEYDMSVRDLIVEARASEPGGLRIGVHSGLWPAIIPLLNYLTLEWAVPIMSDGGGGGPDACGIMANLWRLIQAVVDDAEPGLEALGLSAKAFFLLEAVGEHPFPAVLARRMHLPPPTVTYLVKQLEERGFLVRQTEPGDLRRFRLVQTDAGREALRRGREALSLALCKRLGRLERGEVVAFDRMVGRLVGNGEVPES